MPFLVGIQYSNLHPFLNSYLSFPSLPEQQRGDSFCLFIFIHWDMEANLLDLLSSFFGSHLTSFKSFLMWSHTIYLPCIHNPIKDSILIWFLVESNIFHKVAPSIPICRFFIPYCMNVWSIIKSKVQDLL